MNNNQKINFEQKNHIYLFSLIMYNNSFSAVYFAVNFN